MANLIFSYQNRVDGAMLSASQAAGDLSVANLANPVVGRRWRTTSLTASFQADFGTDVALDLLALVFPRDTAFPTAGTVRHRLDADGGTPGSGAAYDSGAAAIGTVAGYGYHVHLLGSTVNARYWDAAFNVSGVAFIDVGRAWAGAKFQPSRNYQFGLADRWDDLSRIAASGRSGAEFVDARPRRREIAFAVPFAQADFATAREMQRILGLAGQVLMVRDPDAALGTETILGRLAETTPILHQALPIQSKAFVIRESL